LLCLCHEFLPFLGRGGFLSTTGFQFT